jgi:hypothetical protein
VSIDDLLAVVREFLNPEVSRSGLDRCLRRHGVGTLAGNEGLAHTETRGVQKAALPTSGM